MLTGWFLAVGCELPGSRTPSTDIELSRAEWDEYWRQLERRWPAFFKAKCVSPPSLPDSEVMRSWVRFQEVPAAYLSTCTYGNRLIRVGDDKWQSGCVPHEMGHAVCDFIDGTICREFEHPGYRSRCPQ
jgi:hypothetical protein